MEFVTPAGWGRGSGYAHGVSASGTVVCVSGQIGRAGDGRISGDLPGQVRAALANVVAVVRAAGGAPSDIARLTWFVLDKDEYVRRRREVGEAYREVMGAHFPAMSLVQVGGLVDEGALVEIEATAVVPPSGEERSS